MDKNLLQYKGSKKLIVIIAFITLGQSAAIIGQAVYLARAIVSMYEGAASSAVLSSFAYFLVLYTIRHLLQWWKSRLAYRFADDTARHMEQLLINRLFQLGPRAVGKHGSGNLVTLAIEGIPSFRTYLELFIPRMIAMLAIPIPIFLYVFWMDKLSGIILALVIPIMIAFLILLGLAAKKQINSQMGTYILLSRHFVDSLRGLVTLKFLGRSKRHRDSIETVSDKFRIATIKTMRIAFLSGFSLDFFSTLSVAVVAVELGLRLIEGNILFEPALTILILAPEYFFPIKDFGNDYHATMDGKEAGKQIHCLLDEENVLEELTFPIGRWNGKSTLVVQGLEKKSEDGESILNPIDIEVNGFQKIGIVGLSGAGKSTLIDILSGFSRPTAGTLIVNGLKMPHFSITDWLNQVAYIPQHPYIFSGTVADNIRLYEPEASMDQVKAVAEKTGLLQLIESFPNGFEERIGQGGRSLSGGEEQRIALARGLLQNRPILIFDEPTAHLDIETEHDIKRMMLPLMENKLVFFATHRLHWMKNMDQIIVIEKGRIVERGTHSQLYDKKGAYYRLVQAHQGGGRYDIV
ncbi:thiol reductant ABC exporter subunit CydD [Fervidibacillus halotolerans]|uniref:Thiol reductant ABC exporter subunit CydD n=1 Tax=Fervidibacillus halotolerans TaxID=2980027 RepID=A0A9E8M108_9BACI|nr:thiol reductant ABC exporter subunit CydD [Fervidibacillus halotolerans]WAA12920.1 thiol reductant ABC exporter subunit CydD [Fervidibacillus halotolerans]